MNVVLGVVLGLFFWFVARYAIGGFFTIGPNERAVLCTFGRAQRLGELSTLNDPLASHFDADERERYDYPQVRVIGPGFYWKLPWQSLHRASIATATVSIAFDPEDPKRNAGGQVLEAVTKDQLNTGLSGQLRYTVTERNLYAFLFGVKNPVAHVMGYFVSILRNRIANFEAPGAARAAAERSRAERSRAEFSGAPNTGAANAGAVPAGAEAAADTLGGVQGISINDLRKNLRDLNESMDRDCAGAAPRYGIQLDAALITGIDPPPEVDSALAAINTAHNHVSSEISLAQAAADQRIVQSRRAVEIETLNAEAEVEPLLALANQLGELAGLGGPGAVDAYVRNAKLALHRKARHLLLADAAPELATQDARR